MTRWPLSAPSRLWFNDAFGEWAGIAAGAAECRLWVDSGYPAMRERFDSDPRIGQSKNTAFEIVTRNQAHFSRELRA